jgi:hypothetical protein
MTNNNNNKSKTRKNSKNNQLWKNQKPGYHQRSVMWKKCGKKCFLGTKKSFPICKKNTCTVSKKGVYAAYVRAREYSSKTGKRKYKTVATRAKRMLQKM